jgi:catechol 2,3-dioxygenase-like lactoylglutathione lyase family enzyme
VTRGSLHHVGLTVRDIERSERTFYAPVLGFLGYERVAGPSHVAFWRDPQSGPTLHLVRGEGDLKPPANDHCAFRVDSRERVNDLHQFLLDQRIEVLSAPADYPQFGKGHYAVFFQDPDGRLFEALHRPAAAAAP